MIGETVAIAVVVIGLVLSLSPGRAVGVIIASMLLWPEYLRMPLGVVQMSIPRAAALALVLRLGLTGAAQGKPLRWNVIDVVVIVAWAWDVVANLMMQADQTQMIQMTGRVLDTVLMYFAARLALRSPGEWRAAVGPVVLTAIVMGTLGTIESVTSWSAYAKHYAVGGNPWFDKGAEYRYGFLRARGSAAHSIYFGVAMAMLVGLLWSMRGIAKSKGLVWVGIGAAFLGTLSSLSSGPQIAVVTLMLCGAFYYARWAIKPAVAGLVFACVVVELGSNRHFFQLADYLALSSETAWYRGRLMEVAFERVGDYAIAGVGGRTPHATWGMLIDTRQHVDVVNHFIIVALYGGLASLFMFLTIQISAIRGCARVSAWTKQPQIRALAFGLACSLLMLMVASLSIGLFGPPLLMTYLLMGSMVSVGGWEREARHKPAGVSNLRPRGNGVTGRGSTGGQRGTGGKRGSGVLAEAMRAGQEQGRSVAEQPVRLAGATGSVA